MATYVPAKKNNIFIFYVGLISQADTKLLKANPTLAAGDVKVAIDDGVPGNLTTLPVVDADFTKRVKVSLSATEMNGDNITVIFSDAAGAEWCDLIVSIQTTVNQIDDLTTGGAGSIAWPFIVTQTGGGTVAGAEVWVSADSDGTDVIANGITDTNGLYTFHLDAGSYWFWAQHSGLNPASVYETVA